MQPSSVSIRAELEPDFFVAGGTLSVTAESYICREADGLLFDSLIAGRFAYVLNSRQMGKSSLSVRTMKRLNESGVRTAFVDLTRMGGANVSPEQWYAGIVSEIGRTLGLRQEMGRHWKDHADLSPMQRMFGALREVALAQFSEPVVVFFDEIDASRSLPFSADEFFAGIRECYNRRVHDEAFRRLTFCLLGVAVPTDLIRDTIATPFNIGDRIYLKDFTLDEVRTFAEGISSGNRDTVALVDRVYYWTHGHPYLTQSVCAAIAADHAIKSVSDVDALIHRDLLDPEARETNINLADVGNRALHAGDTEPDPEKFRADLLSIFKKTLGGKSIPDDESNRVAVLLKLSGIMRSEGNRLYVRNRIYERVFDANWVSESMPLQEERRQKRAFWKGVLRTGTVAIVVLLVIGYLALSNGALAAKNAILADLNARQRDVAEYQAYISDVNYMRTTYEDSDFYGLAGLVADTKDSRYRNLEWSYWNAQLHDAPYEMGFPKGVGQAVIAHDEKSLCVYEAASHSVAVFSFPDLRRISGPYLSQGATSPLEVDGHWCWWDQTSSLKWVFPRLDHGAQLSLRAPESSDLNVSGISLNTRYMLCSWGRPVSTNLILFDTASGKTVWQVNTPHFVAACGVSDDGKILAWRESFHGSTLNVFDRSKQKLIVSSSDGKRAPPLNGLVLSADGRRVATGNVSGVASVFDVPSKKVLFQKGVSPAYVSSVEMSRDGTRLLTLGNDQVAKVWDVESGNLLCSKPGADAATHLSPDGQYLVVLGAGLRIYRVSAQSSSETRIPFAQTLALGDGDNAAVVAETGVWVCNLRTFSKRQVFSLPPTHKVNPLSTNGRSFSYDDGHSRSVYSLATGQVIATLPTGTMGIEADRSYKRFLVASADTQKIGAYGFNGHLLWMATSSTFFTCAHWSPTGDQVVAGCNDGSVVLFDGATGKVLHTFHRNTNTIRAVAISPNGKWLAAGDDDFCVQLFDLEQMRPYLPIPGHLNSITGIAFSPDSSRVASSALDGVVRICDTKTGQETLRLGGHESEPLETLRFSADGRYLVTLNVSGVLRRYDFVSSFGTSK